MTDNLTLIGEEAHIIAKSKSGPRGSSDLPAEHRDYYENLILLCPTHHTVIDNQENKYTIETLRKYKSDHESWVENNLALDKRKQREEEYYSSIIDQISEKARFDDWHIWTSWILGFNTSIQINHFNELKLLPNFILSRIWPKRYSTLESSFENFRLILIDFIKVIRLHEQIIGENITVESFYREFYRENYRDESKFKADRVDQAIKEYYFHIALIQDLVLELTRAANLICDYTREFIFDGYRLKEGVLLVVEGDESLRCQYSIEEIVANPYRNLLDFMKTRESRDKHYGKGTSENYEHL